VAKDAEKRGMNGVSWFIVVVIGGPIGLMLYFHGGHYAISFIAPALYGMIIMDILMFNATRKDETYR